jgi:DNA-directed RNA polymerase sigma subunit (sigma70/sigma32)
MAKATRTVEERIAALREAERRRQKIAKMRAAGKSMQAIGDALGLSKQRIDQILKGAGA